MDILEHQREEDDVDSKNVSHLSLDEKFIHNHDIALPSTDIEDEPEMHDSNISVNSEHLNHNEHVLDIYTKTDIDVVDSDIDSKHAEDSNVDQESNIDKSDTFTEPEIAHEALNIDHISDENENLVDSQTQESSWWNYISTFVSRVRQLYLETKKGPWQLGPIDTTKYYRQQLDGPILNLLNEVFDIQGHQQWIMTQIMFFFHPVIYGLGGPIINRFILRSTSQIISEENIAGYLLTFRCSFWPNNHPCPKTPPRSVQEKKQSRHELEMSLLQHLSRMFILTLAIISPLIGTETANERIVLLLNTFQDQKINKHLIFILLDLILLAHLLPEYSESRKNVM